MTFNKIAKDFVRATLGLLFSPIGIFHINTHSHYGNDNNSHYNNKNNNNNITIVSTTPN